MMLYVSLMYNCLILTINSVKTGSVRQKGLLNMSHFLNQSMVCINVSINALKDRKK